MLYSGLDLSKNQWTVERWRRKNRGNKGAEGRGCEEGVSPSSPGEGKGIFLKNNYAPKDFVSDEKMMKWLKTRDVTKFEFKFDDVWIMATSGVFEYFEAFLSNANSQKISHLSLRTATGEHVRSWFSATHFKCCAMQHVFGPDRMLGRSNSL